MGKLRVQYVTVLISGTLCLLMVTLTSSLLTRTRPGSLVCENPAESVSSSKQLGGDIGADDVDDVNGVLSDRMLIVYGNGLSSQLPLQHAGPLPMLGWCWFSRGPPAAGRLLLPCNPTVS